MFEVLKLNNLLSICKWSQKEGILAVPHIKSLCGKTWGSDLADIKSSLLLHTIFIKYFNELRFLKMDEMRTTNQVEEVNKRLKEIPKEAEERRIENQPQTGKNEKAIEPF
ncbi:hypothetical protein WQ54_11270 [Bacillus sp. SA1-12]|uniref:hypothetical protein n=1 Tax=Bacillus sp. SA1-12 TaxID=1455638 RepID=UPI0006266E1B|nr:hypothetical protein [Bacillus sp. SA1-12]KKI92143.1 hypothetical protein WQ54_11270 [Bacillus sp. SA1-12]